MKTCPSYAAYQRHLKAGEHCDACREAAREYQRKKYLKAKASNPERLRRQSLEAGRRRKARDPEAEKLRLRRITLQSRYGLTLEQWEDLFDFQDRKCARCGSETTGHFNWATDHNHDTGTLRGILCHACNNLLGRLGDDANGVVQSTTVFLNYLRSSGETISQENAAILIALIEEITV